MWMKSAQFENTIILLNKAIVSGGHTALSNGVEIEKMSSKVHRSILNAYFIEMGYGADISQINAFKSWLVNKSTPQNTATLAPRFCEIVSKSDSPVGS